MISPGRFGRRAVLRAGAGALAAPYVLRFGYARAADNLFALGVASGEPWPRSVVLWTRLMRAGDDPGTPASPEAEVQWEIAEDERFQRVTRRGAALAQPDSAHSVHVEADGLAPGRWYWYRFVSQGLQSPVGRTRTAPAAATAADKLEIGFCSCQHWEHGFYAAHRHLAAEPLDLVLFLGDYIYEISYGRERVRAHDSHALKTLAEYRRRYALYKSDPDLQAAHAAFAWSVIPDDHEVENDYAGERSENLTDPAEFLKLRAAAYRAYYEHMPLRRAQAPSGQAMQIYRRLDLGSAATLLFVDGRQFRAPQPCPKPGRGGANVVGEDCAERTHPRQTMLGKAQEAWLDRELRRGTARWTVIAQQTLLSQLDQNTGQGRRFWTEAWDGYPAARRRLVDSIADLRVANPVIVGGDMHAFYACDVKRDFDRPRSPAVASEFVGGSITSQPLRQEFLDRWIKNNPHMHLAEGRWRGYGRLTLAPKDARVEFKALENEKVANAPIRTLAAYAVESGRPGVHPA